MQQINQITSNPDQRMTLILENNESVNFRIYYSKRMMSWFYDFTYGNLTVNCSKVVLTPNSLRNFNKIIPFGFAFLADGAEPFGLEDFESGRVQFYVLNKEEVEEIEKEIFNQ